MADPPDRVCAERALTAQPPCLEAASINAWEGVSAHFFSLSPKPTTKLRADRGCFCRFLGIRQRPMDGLDFVAMSALAKTKWRCARLHCRQCAAWQVAVTGADHWLARPAFQKVFPPNGFPWFPAGSARFCPRFVRRAKECTNDAGR